MKMVEYGQENREVIMLLHGGGMSWWNYRDAAQLLAERYHVVLPILDGHAQSECSFESIEANAKRILAVIDERYHGHVLALGGLSLGAQIAVEILAERPDVCSCALIESVSLFPSRLTHMLIGPAFSSSWFLIQYRWFARLQFRSLHIREALFEDYYRDTCMITKEDMIAFLKANTAYRLPKSIVQSHAEILAVVGQREQRNLIRSARALISAKPSGKLYIAEGLYHGELSMNYPEKYVQLLTAWISRLDMIR